MFKRLFNRGNKKTGVKKKGIFSFKRWFKKKPKEIKANPSVATINRNKSKKSKLKKQGFKRWFKKKPKEIAPSPSIKTLFRNKYKQSKLSIKHINLIQDMDAKELQKRFSVKGSRAKALEGMVADYKQGNLSLPGFRHKSKFDSKTLNKDRLNKMINRYDGESKKRNAKEAQNSAKILKKKFNMTKSQANKLEKLMTELNQGKGSKVHLIKTLLDPNKLTKERVEKFIKQYEEAQKKNRGLSYIKLSFVSISKMQNLMEDVKGLSGILKKYI